MTVKVSKPALNLRDELNVLLAKTQQPRSIGFRSRLANTISAVAGDTSLRDVAWSEYHDNGNAFDATNGVFTAPVSGIYIGQCQIYTQYNDAATDCNWYIAGLSSGASVTYASTVHTTAGWDYDANAIHHHTFPATFQFRMNKGDTAWLSMYSNDTSYTILNSTLFAISLISQE